MTDRQSPTTELGESLNLDTEAAVGIRERLNNEGFDADGDTVLSELIDVLKLVIELRKGVTEPDLSRKELLKHVEQLHDETNSAVTAYIRLLKTIEKDRQSDTDHA